MVPSALFSLESVWLWGGGEGFLGPEDLLLPFQCLVHEYVDRFNLIQQMSAESSQHTRLRGIKIGEEETLISEELMNWEWEG